MSQLLKQCLCPTRWRSIAEELDNMGESSPFRQYFEKALKNGWSRWRLYPKQFNNVQKTYYPMAVQRTQNTQPTTVTQNTQPATVTCSQCDVRYGGFIQFSCNFTSDRFNSTPHTPYIIDVCCDCVSKYNIAPECFWCMSSIIKHAVCC